MALYYFKTLYPNARITAFEPVPELHRMAKNNVELNEYSDIQVLPYALAAEDGTATFFVSEEYPLAGTLTHRRHEMGDTMHEVEVEQRRLSGFLDEPAHFLKLDIEGSEDAVLQECGDKLSRVQNLFVEYHHGLGMAPGRLQRILALLNDVGFEYQLQKSFNFATSAPPRMLAHVGEPYSLNIWARNATWSQD